jgi:hypothetical protein
MNDKSADGLHIERVSSKRNGTFDADGIPLTGYERQKAEKALIRKLDTRLLGPVVVIYIMNYIDVGFSQLIPPRLQLIGRI